MPEMATIGLALAKNVVQLHGSDGSDGSDGSGKAVLHKKLRRDQVLDFLSILSPCVVALAACGGTHFWGREIGKLGPEVRLI